jgi:ribonuclease HI
MITIFTDGGSRGNPGPAGSGAVIYQGKKKVAEVSKFLGMQTNNFAEYEALLLALEATRAELGSPIKELVTVKMDSELIVRQMTGIYKVKDPTLKLKHAEAKRMIVESFPKIEFVHIRREFNSEADQLANDAMDRGS